MISYHQYLLLLSISAHHPKLITLHMNFSICKGNMFCDLPQTDLAGDLGDSNSSFSLPHKHLPYVYLGWLPCFRLFGFNNKNSVSPPKYISVEQVGYPLHSYECG